MGLIAGVVWCQMQNEWTEVNENTTLLRAVLVRRSGPGSRAFRPTAVIASTGDGGHSRLILKGICDCGLSLSSSRAWQTASEPHGYGRQRAPASHLHGHRRLRALPCRPHGHDQLRALAPHPHGYGRLRALASHPYGHRRQWALAYHPHGHWRLRALASLRGDSGPATAVAPRTAPGWGWVGDAAPAPRRGLEVLVSGQ